MVQMQVSLLLFSPFFAFGRLLSPSCAPYGTLFFLARGVRCCYFLSPCLSLFLFCCWPFLSFSYYALFSFLIFAQPAFAFTLFLRDGEGFFWGASPP